MTTLDIVRRTKLSPLRWRRANMLLGYTFQPSSVPWMLAPPAGAHEEYYRTEASIHGARRAAMHQHNVAEVARFIYGRAFMTGPQAEWLKKHQQYRAIGNTPSQHRWTERKMLHPDGSTDDSGRGARPRVLEGSFEVGVLQLDPAFQPRR